LYTNKYSFFIGEQCVFIVTVRERDWRWRSSILCCHMDSALLHYDS